MNQFKNKSCSDIVSESDALLEHLQFSAEQAQYLAESTILQSKSVLWFEHRKGRITASLFGSISKTSLERPSQSIIDQILQVKSVPNIPALEWGKTKEEDAIKTYLEITSGSRISISPSRHIYEECG